ncbi:MAG: sugar transferase [Nonlabens sp.]|uniref:sugar transferase n=1 Tax=Nonlabens sp. TaxID=1888209 RepID=UPI003EF7D2EB
MSQPGSIHFEISERKILLRIIDVAIVLGALHLVGVVFDFDYFKINEEHWSWIIVLGSYLLFFATVFELYHLQRASRVTATLRGVVFTSSLTSLFYLLTPFFTPSLPENRLQILYFYLAITLSLLIWRAIYLKLFSSSRFYKNILIIADATDAAQVANTLQEADPNYKIAGYINTDIELQIGHDDRINVLTIQEAKDRLEGQEVSEIVIASSHVEGITPELYDWLIELVENGFSVREYTQIYEEITNRVPVQYVGKDFYKYFPFARNNNNKLYMVYHRCFDILFSVLGILIGIIIVPFIFLGNLIGNRGSLFYKQRRVGKNRKHFQIYKFRTMVKNAEAYGAQFASKNDSRITPFGKFLRKTRLDEFPQFYNILKGEMSIIGPRPERPIFVKELSKKIPFYETRHVVKPGLTGWAQVKTKYGETEADSLRKLQYDLYYIKHRSVFLDLRIVVKTLSTIIFFKGQ